MTDREAGGRRQAVIRPAPNMATHRGPHQPNGSAHGEIKHIKKKMSKIGGVCRKSIVKSINRVKTFFFVCSFIYSSFIFCVFLSFLLSLNYFLFVDFGLFLFCYPLSFLSHLGF